MNASIISTLAALAGAAIGEFTSVLASWLTQRTQARAQWLAQDKIRRQDLYKEFIEAASLLPSAPRPADHIAARHEQCDDLLRRD